VVQEWLKTQLANNFEAYAGARLSGSVPFTESMLNRWLESALTDHGALLGASDGEIHLAALKHFVASARVEIGEGVLTLHFELKV
jgi:hypothetical protein